MAALFVFKLVGECLGVVGIVASNIQEAVEFGNQAVADETIRLGLFVPDKDLLHGSDPDEDLCFLRYDREVWVVTRVHGLTGEKIAGINFAYLEQGDD